MNRKEYTEYKARVASDTSNYGFVTDRNAHEINRILQGELHKTLEILPPGSIVLEVGIGRGNALDELRKQYPHLKIVGTNFFETGKNPSKTQRIAKAEASALPFKRSTFDLVFSVHTWQHVPDKIRFLREVHRVLKRTGTGLVHARLAYNNLVIRNGEKRLVGGSAAQFLEKSGQITITDDEVLRIKKHKRTLLNNLAFDIERSRHLDDILSHNFISAYTVKK